MGVYGPDRWSFYGSKDSDDSGDRDSSDSDSDISHAVDLSPPPEVNGGWISLDHGTLRATAGH